jgi:hypothetical protein
MSSRPTLMWRSGPTRSSPTDPWPTSARTDPLPTPALKGREKLTPRRGARSPERRARDSSAARSGMPWTSAAALSSFARAGGGSSNHTGAVVAVPARPVRRSRRRAAHVPSPVSSARIPADLAPAASDARAAPPCPTASRTRQLGVARTIPGNPGALRSHLSPAMRVPSTAHGAGTRLPARAKSPAVKQGGGR